MKTLSQIQYCIVLLVIGVTQSVAGSFSEGFASVNQLPNDGWTFENRSDFIGDAFWGQGFGSFFPAQQGPADSYILGTVGQTGGNVLCDWLILPDIGFVEQLNFFTRTESNSMSADRLMVVYSESGSLQTGPCVFNDATRIGGFDFGDFELLQAVNPNLSPGGYPEQWTEVNVPVNGNGRLALVYFVEDVAQSPFNGNLIAIDSINIGPAAPQGTPTAVPGLNLFGMIVLGCLMLIFLAFNIQKMGHFKE